MKKAKAEVMKKVKAENFLNLDLNLPFSLNLFYLVEVVFG